MDAGWIAFYTAIASAIAGILNNWISTRPKLKELENKDREQQQEIEALKFKDQHKDLAIRELETKHKDCEEHLNTQWPSDHEPLIAVMCLLKTKGLPHTFRDAVRFIKQHERDTQR